jgi:Arm DNA-binding domain
MALSGTNVRRVRAKDKDYTLSDTDGLALFVSATGSKYWYFRFCWGGKQQRISLGTYPEISLKDARVRRDEARSLVAKGLKASIRALIVGTNARRPLSRPQMRPWLSFTYGATSRH